MDAFEVVACAAHEGITEAVEVCAVIHFFGEDISNIAFSRDMSDGDGANGDPLPGQVFSIFDVAVPKVVILRHNFTHTPLL
jgi:hypothetical protein